MSENAYTNAFGLAHPQSQSSGANPKIPFLPWELTEMRAGLSAKVQVSTNLPGLQGGAGHAIIAAAVRRHDLPFEWGTGEAAS